MTKWQEWNKFAEDERNWIGSDEHGLLKAEYLGDGEYSLIWLNPDTGAYDEQAIDIAPECIRFFCERYGTQVKANSNQFEIETTIA